MAQTRNLSHLLKDYKPLLEQLFTALKRRQQAHPTVAPSVVQNAATMHAMRVHPRMANSPQCLAARIAHYRVDRNHFDRAVCSFFVLQFLDLVVDQMRTQSAQSTAVHSMFRELANEHFAVLEYVTAEFLRGAHPDRAVTVEPLEADPCYELDMAAELLQHRLHVKRELLLLARAKDVLKERTQPGALLEPPDALMLQVIGDRAAIGSMSQAASESVVPPLRRRIVPEMTDESMESLPGQVRHRVVDACAARNGWLARCDSWATGCRHRPSSCCGTFRGSRVCACLRNLRAWCCAVRTSR